MPIYEEKIDDNDAICPYCEHRVHVEAEDYDEDCRQETCESCGKTYWLNENFSVTHTTRPDCGLNGQEHVYERITFKDGKQADFCTICDDCARVA